MPTTSQPAASTAIHSDWTTNLIFARNEVETTATTLAAGAPTRSTVGGGVVWNTDADGRYKQGAGSGGLERWTDNGDTAFYHGPTFTYIAILKYADSGGWQVIMDSDNNPPRNFILRMATSSGNVEWVGFDSSENVDGGISPTLPVGTTGYTTVILRVRNDAGTYKSKLWVGGSSSSEVSYAGTPASIGSGEYVAFGDRLGGGHDMTAAKLYFSAIYNTALSDTDCDTLAANGWAIYDSKGSTVSLTESSPVAVATTVSVSGDPAFTVPLDITESSPVAIGTTVTLSGDFAYSSTNLALTEVSPVAVAISVGVSGDMSYSSAPVTWDLAPPIEMSVTVGVAISGDISSVVGLDLAEAAPIGIASVVAVSGEFSYSNLPRANHGMVRPMTGKLTGSLTRAL